jgi:hypothetical protein
VFVSQARRQRAFDLNLLLFDGVIRRAQRYACGNVFAFDLNLLLFDGVIPKRAQFATR